MVKAKKFVIAARFDGLPKVSDFQLVEEDTPELKNGDLLCETLFISVDPYMRPFGRSLKKGDTMIGEVVSRWVSMNYYVIESKSKKYPVGTTVLAGYGWRTHAVVHEDDKHPLPTAQLRAVPADFPKELSPGLLLGVTGMPGMTAYFGLIDVCQAKSGETAFVNAAAGAVGSLVGQIAKIKGCKVIGCAGTDDKVTWLRDLGFDYVFNYKTKSLGEELKKAAPEGIDCYFDNVGGDFSVSVLNNHMKDHGRVAVCGSISTYNNPEAKGHYFFETIITKRLKLQGFFGAEYQADWPAATTQVAKWIVEGKVKHKEHVTNGFDQTPQALIGVLTGKNTGKAIVKI
ncbi:prostaglandin reductase 1-like [Branchiostoma floridae]|uniref:Prostaglandin reductase 1 n=1 Tax=Branchiostoma floridae TaxID=7739 RepID=A0A9J7KK42_BRAFL|nr:prostaglandin reductase 1-like [Branchiostoma floridae]